MTASEEFVVLVAELMISELSSVTWYEKFNDALALAANAKARICIYGSDAVVRQLALFDADGAVLNNPTARNHFLRICSLMRLESGSTVPPDLEDDLRTVLFGPESVRVSPPQLRLRFRDATPEDAPAIAALQNAAAGGLTARFGAGPWSSLTTERSAILGLRHARVRVGREGKRILTVLRLATKKPWAIDVSYFTAVKRPLYLTGMAVSVAHQGQGRGWAGSRSTTPGASRPPSPRTPSGSTRTTQAPVRDTRSTSPAFCISYFELFANGLTNIANSIY